MNRVIASLPIMRNTILLFFIFLDLLQISGESVADNKVIEHIFQLFTALADDVTVSVVAVAVVPDQLHFLDERLRSGVAVVQ